MGSRRALAPDRDAAEISSNRDLGPANMSDPFSICDLFLSAKTIIKMQ